MTELSQEKVSRRGFVKTAAVAAVGVVAGAAIGYGASSTTPAGYRTVTTTETVTQTGTMGTGIPAYTPPPPEELDPYALDPLELYELQNPWVEVFPGPVLQSKFEGPDETRLAQYKKDPPWTIYWVDQGGGNEFSRNIVYAIEKIAERDKRIGELKVLSAYWDSAKQKELLESVYAKGDADAVCVFPMDPTLYIPQYSQLYDAGIPVVSVQGSFLGPKCTVSMVGDNRIFARKQAKWIVKKLKGKGKVIAITGIPGHNVRVQRWEYGAKPLFDSYPGIEIVAEASGEWAYDKSLEVARALMAAHPDFDAAYTDCGATSAAIIDAGIEIGRFFPVTGEDYNGFVRRVKKYRNEPGFDAFGDVSPTWTIIRSIDIATRLLSGYPEKRVTAFAPQALTMDQLCDMAIEEITDAWYLALGLCELTLDELRDFAKSG